MLPRQAALKPVSSRVASAKEGAAIAVYAQRFRDGRRDVSGEAYSRVSR